MKVRIMPLVVTAVVVAVASPKVRRLAARAMINLTGTVVRRVEKP